MIHDQRGAQAYGFRGALVAGVSVFAWAVPVILQAAGDPWLTEGWADVRFRRPIHPGDLLDISAREPGTRDGGGAVLRVENEARELCVAGRFGAGPGLRHAALAAVPLSPPIDTATPRPQLLLATAPTGRELRPFAPDLGPASAAEDSRVRWLAEDARFTAATPLVHPASIARQMIALLRNSFRYGRPSVHVRTQIQLLGPAPAEDGYLLTGRFVRAWAHHGSHYAEIDGCLFRGNGAEVARVRHTNIFRLAKPRSAASSAPRRGASPRD